MQSPLREGYNVPPPGKIGGKGKGGGLSPFPNNPRGGRGKTTSSIGYASLKNSVAYTALLANTTVNLNWNTTLYQNGLVSVTDSKLYAEKAGTYFSFMSTRASSNQYHSLDLIGPSGLTVGQSSYPYSTGAFNREHGGYIGIAAPATKNSLVAHATAFVSTLTGPPSIDVTDTMTSIFMGATDVVWAKGTGTQALSAATAATVTLDTIVQDTLSHSFSGGGLVAAKTGWMIVNFGIYATTANQGLWAQLMVNGVSKGLVGDYWDATTTMKHSGHVVIPVIAGDVITLVARSNNAKTLDRTLCYLNMLYLKDDQVKAGWERTTNYNTGSVITNAIQTDLLTRANSLDVGGAFTKDTGVDIPGEFIIPAGQAGTYLISNMRSALPFIGGSGDWEHGRPFHMFTEVNGTRIAAGSFDHAGYTNNGNSSISGITTMAFAELAEGDRVTMRFSTPVGRNLARVLTWTHVAGALWAYLIKL